MTILELCPRFPFPLTDGGRIGMYNMIRHLALRGNEMHVVAFREADTTDAHVAALREIAVVHPVLDSPRSNLRAFPASVLRREPAYIARHRSPAFTRAVSEAAARAGADAVLGDHSAMFPAVLELQAAHGVARAIRLHNIESVIWKRYAATIANPVLRAGAAWQARMLERFEADHAVRVDVNFTITEVDRDVLRALAPAARAVTVPAGVDVARWSAVRRDPSAAVAIAVGTLAWMHNVEAMIWFIDRVLPLVRARMPRFRLHIVGAGAPRSIRRRAGDAVRVLGYLDDIRPAVERAAIFVAPLHVGGGVRIKILEAMAMGMPVVTTGVGCEGIGGTAGEHYLVADAPEEFAARIAELLAVPERGTAIGDAARAFVAARYRWDLAAGTVERELRREFAAPEGTDG